MSTAEEFQRLIGQLRNEKPAYVLAELNDLLASAPRDQIELLSAPSIDDPYLANYRRHGRAGHSPERGSSAAVMDFPE